MSNKLLLKNIKSLVSTYTQAPEILRGKEMKVLPAIQNAWLAIENGKIADFGSMESFPGISDWKNLEVIDCTNQHVLPGFIDSHTHLVFAGNREQEFADRINGLSYDDIAKRGGGILNSAKLLRQTSENDLFEQSKVRLDEVIAQGTVGIEIKSGYGLDLDSELKMLRVIKRLKDLNIIPIKSTLLGAHAIPQEFKNNKKAYLDLVIHEMLPAAHAEKLVDYIDIFCENGYFSAADTKNILEAGQKYGLKGKIHAEQLSHSNGIKTGVECSALSVDHLEYCNDEDIALLKNSNTMPVILPGAAYFLNLPLPPARKIIDAGCPIAFASDYNPGSCPTGNMKLIISMACIQYKLTPEEAINAVTVNGAYSCDLQNELGSISIGKLANLIVTKEIHSVASLPYAFGSQQIDKIIIEGQVKG